MATRQQAEERVAQLARALRLPAVSRDAVRCAVESVRQENDPLIYLVGLLETELDERLSRRSARRIKEAGFPMVKTLAGFDFQRASHLPEARIRQLSHGEYIKNAEPVLLLGEPGTGKTHLATALGVAAAESGHRIKFVTAAALVTELVEARDAHELARTVGRYGRVDVLIIDELAYVPLTRSDAELLFRVLGERNERRPTIVTTNLPFSEWTAMFPDPRLCRAIVDRLTHKAHIIETGTESARLQATLERRKREQG
jgi:DNA replication protein DnaC